MSDVYRAQGAPQAGPASGPATRVHDDEAGYGWISFAGVMISIAGVLNIIYGIAAIDKSSFYVQDAQYVISDLKTWGWVLLGIGVVQMLVALGVWAKNQLARWLGVLSASINAVIMLLFLPAYPFLALAIFALDVLVIYGLIAHGSRHHAY